MDDEAEALFDATFNQIVGNVAEEGQEDNSNEPSGSRLNDSESIFGDDAENEEDNSVQGQDDRQATTGSESDGDAEDDDQEGSQQPSTDAPKGDLPEELRPHKDLLESKGWDDVSNPSTIAKIVTSFSEAEKIIGEKGREIGTIRAGLDDVKNVMFSNDVNEINKLRELQGYPKLPVPKSIDERRQEHSELTENIKGLLSQDQSVINASIQKLNQYLAKNDKDLERESLLNELKGPSFERRNYVETAKTNFNAYLQNNKEAQANLDALANSPLMNGLKSFGINAEQIASSPERLHTFAIVGEYIRKGMSYDSDLKAGIAKGVQAELKKMKGKSLSSPVGSTSRSGNNNSPEQSSTSMRELFDYAIEN